MRPLYLLCITLLAGCHPQMGAQALTNSAPPDSSAGGQNTAAAVSLPNDPGQELLPVAVPEPEPAAGVPIDWEFQHMDSSGDLVTATGNVVAHYLGYVLRADKVVYNRATTEMEADGHVQVSGGPNDVLIHATHADMRLDTHTARFYNVNGSQGVRTMENRKVYTTANPLLFSGRVMLEEGEGRYRMVDGSITNCRLPHPDWRIVARSIGLKNNIASTDNAFFEFLGVPIVYLPYLRHPSDEASRESGLLIPMPSNSSLKGYVIGEQVYWVINRSMDMVAGVDYYSKRGWAPNGDFRYKGLGYDQVSARWNAVLDRGIVEQIAATPATPNSPAVPAHSQWVNQGGVDISIVGRKDLDQDTRLSGAIEYLSSYTYRLIFNDNYTEATSSQVSSDVALTHNHNGQVSAFWLDRFQTFASTTNGREVRLLHLPELRYDVLDRPLGDSPLYWGLVSSLGYLNRAEPNFHSRNVGRLDLYPHVSLPFTAGGWSFVPEAAVRDTSYTISQIPSLTKQYTAPTLSHEPLNRKDLEAALVVRAPAVERDFTLPFAHRVLRHVVEPELNYRFVSGIGQQARDVLLFDTADIATDVNEAGFSLTQRFYLRPTGDTACGSAKTEACSQAPREWASWQIVQEYFIDPDFGGAVINGRRNVYDATLDLIAATFLTGPRHLAPLVSRMRYEAVDKLSVEWDFDYDTVMGQFNANNLFSTYTFGNTTLGIGHALLNALDEHSTNSATASVTKSQELQPFLQFGKQNRDGFNLAMNSGYNYVQHQFQYGGVQAVYNWNCCGLSLGYRRYELGTVGTTTRDETQWLYGFTIADFGTVGDIRRTNTPFH